MSDKVQEMKKLMKPIIKECLKELLIEQGLTSLIKENVTKQPVKQQTQQFPIKKTTVQNSESLEDAKQKLREAQQKMLKSIGVSGFDPFDGSMPIEDDENSEQSYDAPAQVKTVPGIHGSGVDISRLMGANKKSWNFYNSVLNKTGKKNADE